MKEYYVSFAIKGSLNTDIRACFVSTDKGITETRIIDFRDRIAAEVKLNTDNIVILGITLLDEVEGK